MSNAFERYAETQNMPVRRRSTRIVTSEKHAPLIPTAMEKEQRDQSVQFMRFKKAEHQNLLSSRHSFNYRQLLTILKGLLLTAQSSNELVAYIRRAKWLQRLDDHHRHAVISIIDNKIVRMRVLDGLSPFDDPLPGQPDNAFIAIRKTMMGV
jgi:hypothetical protein